MSKKIIAVAAAAALALAGLVAPANAAGANLTIAPTATVNGTVTGDGLLSTTAWQTPVPSQDVLRSTTTASRSVLAIDVNTRTNGAAVAIASTGSVKLLTAAQLAASTTTTATGTQTLSLTANDSGVVTFYAYTTSTSAGSITATESGTTPASNTAWLIGTTNAANAYKINFTAPASAGLGAEVEYVGTVVDMFGNALSTPVLAASNLGGDATAAGTPAYSSTKKTYSAKFTNRTTAGVVALSVSVAISADAVTAFGSKVTSQFFTINGADLAGQVTALTAQVAALTADYNALAKKYNKLVKKSKRVATK